MVNKKEAVVNLIKTVGSIASSAGSVALICGITRAILPPGVNVIVSGAMAVGGTILGGFIGDKLTDYVDGQIDDIVKLRGLGADIRMIECENEPEKD